MQYCHTPQFIRRNNQLFVVLSTQKKVGLKKSASKMDFRFVISTLESTRKHVSWNFAVKAVLPHFSINNIGFVVLSTQKKVGLKKSASKMDFRFVISTLESTRKHVSRNFPSL
jgi:hypothetical protein